MSKNVDDRIVQMQFDNKQFESGIQTSVKSIDNLKKSLDFTGTGKGLSQLNSAASKGVDLSGITRGVDYLSGRFDNLGIVAITAIQNITNKGIAMAEQWAKDVTAPLAKGFSEYEQGLTSMQTIIANTRTKGTSVDEINKAMAELNDYANETKFSFGDMNTAVGLFTAQGVSLEDSVSAIKGIFNAIAMTGGDAQKANGLIVQLSQGIASGTIKAQDWISVVTSGIGGTDFQNMLRETAKVHKKTTDSMIKQEKAVAGPSEAMISIDFDLQHKQQALKDLAKDHSLTAKEMLSQEKTLNKQIEALELRKEKQTGKDQRAAEKAAAKAAAKSGAEGSESFKKWLEGGELTSDVLVEVLKMYGNEIDVTKMKAEGFSDAFIKSAQEMGKTAQDSATQLKTYTQLQDTLKSNVITGWATSFKIVIGNLDEATQLWTKVGEVIGGVLTKMADSRNNLLQGWKDLGGRKDLIEGLGNVFKFLGDILKPIGDAFREIFPPKTAKDLYNLTHSFLEFSQKLTLSAKQAETIKDIFKGVFQVLKMGAKIIGAVFGGIVKFISALVTGGDIFTPIVDMFKKIIETFTGGFGIIGDSAGAVGSTLAGLFGNITTAISPILTKIRDLFTEVGKAVAIFFGVLFGKGEDYGWQWFMDGTTVVDNFLAKVGEMAFFLREDLYAAFGKVWDGIKSFVGDVGSTLGSFADGLGNVGGSVKRFFDNWKLFWRIGDVKLQFKLQPIKDALQGFADAISTIWGGIKEIAGPFVDMIVSIVTCITDLFDALGRQFKTDPNTVLDLFNGAMFAAVMYNLAKLLNIMRDWAKVGDEFFKSVNGVLDGLKGTLKAYQKDIKAKALERIAISIALLAGAVIILSQIDPKKLGVATGAIAGLFAMLSGTMIAVSRFTKGVDIGSLGGAALAMIGLAAASLAMASAVKTMGSLSWEELGKGLTGMIVCMGLLVMMVKMVSGQKVSKVPGVGEVAADVDMAKAAVMMMGFAASIKILAGALSKIAQAVGLIGSMDVPTMIKGLLGMGLILGALYVFMKYADVEKFGYKQASAIFILGGAIVIIGKTIKMLGEMKTADLAKGLAAITAVFGGIFLFVKNLKDVSLEKAAGGILALAGAVLGIAVAMRIIGGMKMEEIVKGITTIGFILAELAVAMRVMKGAEVDALVILALAGACLALAMAMRIIGKMSWKQIAKGIAGVAAILVILGGAMAIMAPFAEVIIPMSIALLAMGGAAFLAGMGLFLFATALTALLAIGVAGMGTLVLMIEELATTIPTLAIEIAKGIGAFCAELTLQLPKILTFLEQLIGGLIEKLTLLIPKLGPLIQSVIDLLCTKVVTVENVQKLTNAGLAILNGVLKGIEDNIKKPDGIVQTVGNIVVAFINEFGNQIINITNALFDTFVKVLNGVADAIRAKHQAMIDAVVNVVDAIVDAFEDASDAFNEVGKMVLRGFLHGLEDTPLLGRVVKKVEDLAGYTRDTMEGPNGIDAHSPSKIFAEYGRNIVQGLIVGVAQTGQQLKSAVQGTVSVAKNAMVGGLAQIKDAWNMDVDANPTIRPVVDMTNVQTGIDDTFKQAQTLNVGASATKASYIPAARAAALVDATKVVASKTDKLEEKKVEVHIHNPQVRNDNDIRKISQDLQHVLDRYAGAKGVVPA